MAETGRRDPSQGDKGIEVHVDERIKCQMCQDVGTCTFCPRGRGEAEETDDAIEEKAA